MLIDIIIHLAKKLKIHNTHVEKDHKWQVDDKWEKYYGVMFLCLWHYFISLHYDAHTFYYTYQENY